MTSDISKVASRFFALVFSGLVLVPAGAAAPEQGQALPKEASAGWWSEAQKNLRESEYHVTRQPGGLQAPNRAQGLRTWFDEQGALSVPRDAASKDAAAWKWGLELKSWGWKDGAGLASEPAEPSAAGNVVTYDRGSGLIEEYVNSEKGLKSNYHVKSAPPGAGSTLRLELSVRGGTTPSDGGDGIDFCVAPGGAKVIRYAGLKAWDADGRDLPCRLGLEGEGATQRVVIEAEAAGARFPVTIDPLATSSAWTAEIDQYTAQFGSSVASAGDTNGDGYSDVIVGALYYDNGQSDEGRVFVYLGGASGLASTAAWTAESNQAGALFGCSVASAGDVNGDGYSDVIVGARVYNNGQSEEGGAFVYLGGASGLASTAAWTAESNQAYSEFGQSVASAGDVNGDGYSDVIVGARNYDNGQANEGRAFVYLGGASGLASSAAWTAESDLASAYFGQSVSPAGDVNGDGYSDVIVGASSYYNGQSAEGRAFVYLGGASGLASTAAWTAESDQISAWFGYRVASAGDVNGDGYSDVIVGALYYDNGQSDEGRAFVYLGGASGLASTAAWTAESDQASAQFGLSVASAGDVNGDGYSDVIVGALYYDNGQNNEGRAYFYLGSASGLASTAAWTAESNQASATFGISVASAGDVNGDGYSDVIVGANAYDNGQTNEGRAFVYLGSASGLSQSAGWTAESDQASAQFGYSVASAGDTNGDGYSDVIVGAPYYDNGEFDEGRAFVYLGSASGFASTAAWTAESDQTSALFGWSVASAGDVNGDGYSDVIVGARLFDNEQSDEGRAFVYLGSASGLASTAAWTAESDQADALFGWSVASAGDVNGDGYSDVIVGAYRYDNGQIDEGRAFVYLGGASGLASTASWTAESNQASAIFGWSVASGGDVNGDGYSDVIVGASTYDNGEFDEGRAYLYLGGASGLASTAAWTAESNQASAWFGSSVASAGDVNGDGYSDVIVGASYYANGQDTEGRAFVYLGGASGLASTAAWTAESDQAYAYFGWSVASAGDVNGDGYSDVIIGAQSYDNGEGITGRAFVYLGGAAGLASTAAWTAESDQASAEFGWSVASAGDVNGDGYSDVIVGAPYYDNGQSDEGRAYVYYGNGEAGRGLSLAPRQRRGDDSAPLAVGGLSNDPAGIRLAALGRTPYGRGKVKLEWETKPADSPFDGTGVGQSSSWIDTGTAGAALSELIGGQAASSRYHWRIRLLYDKATASPQQASRWMTLGPQAQPLTGSTTFRTGAAVPVSISSFAIE